MKYVADNLPQHRPGIYQIRNVVTGWVYIGISQNVAFRGVQHERLLTTTPKIKEALRSAPDDFVFEPIYYQLGAVDYEHLMREEAALIAEKDSVCFGYNSRSASGSGRPAGKEYGVLISRALQTSEEKLRRSKASKNYKASPGVKEAHAEAMRRWFASNKDFHAKKMDEARLRISQATKAAMARHDVKANMQAANASKETFAKRSSAQKKANADPVLRAKKSDAMKRVWAERRAKVTVAKEVTT